MGRAKDIILKVIPAKIANDFVKRWHYSGKVVNNSQLHFGAFLNNVLHGVLSFGPSLDKRKIVGLVEGTLWNEFIELNRMAFDDVLPRNSESRCIAIAMKLLKKHAPHIKWVISFADAAQCGDGAIYRASGFVLTGINENRSILELPDGYRFAGPTVTCQGHKGGNKVKAEIKNRVSQTTITKGRAILSNGAASLKDVLSAGASWVPGFQLRYIYFIDKAAKENLTVPEIPFSRIDEIGAGMYKGKNVSIAERRKPATVVQGSTSGSQPEDDGRTDPVAQR